MFSKTTVQHFKLSLLLLCFRLESEHPEISGDEVRQPTELSLLSVREKTRHTVYDTKSAERPSLFVPDGMACVSCDEGLTGDERIVPEKGVVQSVLDIEGGILGDRMVAERLVPPSERYFQSIAGHELLMALLYEGYCRYRGIERGLGLINDAVQRCVTDFIVDPKGCQGCQSLGLVFTARCGDCHKPTLSSLAFAAAENIPLSQSAA
jgi:hypothetical protein